MPALSRLLGFVRPYAGAAIVSLALLAALVALDLALPRLIQHVIDQAVATGDRAELVKTSVAMLALSALSLAFALGNNALSVRVGEGVARDLREALFLHIQRLSFGNLDRLRTGPLLVRLTSDVGMVKLLTQVTLRIGTRAPLLMVGSLVLMVRTSADLALRLAPVLGLAAVLIVVFVVRMEPLFARVQRRLDAVNDVLQENVAGARLVKAFVRAEHESRRFEAVNRAMAEESTRVMRVVAFMTPSLTLSINAGVVVVVAFGGADAIRGALSVGQLVAFSNYLLTTMTPLVMMTMLSNVWASGLASMRRIEDVLATAPDVTDGEGAVDVPPDAPAEVQLEGVSFRYRSAARDAASSALEAHAEVHPVLADVSLAARRGQTVAVLGATGSGKSTLLHLIPRFYDPVAGVVRVFGADVRTLRRASLGARIGLVPQEALLFSGTVRDNIRYGRPTASDDEVRRAAEAAQAHDFITKLEGGYDARVEARGANLSGGQRQRIAIARALLVEPDVLLLDDATSAVDVDTESRIQRALAAAHATRTTVVVAQRLSTVLEADTIFVLDEGRIVARGTHRELLASSRVYQEIYDSQLGGRRGASEGDASDAKEGA